MQVVLSVGETQLGKKLTRLDWEKAVYQSLFTLANTLHIYGKVPVLTQLLNIIDKGFTNAESQIFIILMEISS